MKSTKYALYTAGCISIGRLLALGARGYKFKSCHPDALRIYDSEGISIYPHEVK